MTQGDIEMQTHANPITERQLQIIRHALGMPEDYRCAMDLPEGYRNHFVTGEGSEDFEDCEALVAAGMMTRHEKDWMPPDDFIYVVTEQGRRVAAEA